MGLRFRKTIKLGKFLKLNINKGSISLSAGVKGAHVTVNNKGKKTASVGIPGSGLSYSKVLDSGNKKSTKKNSKVKDITDNIEDQIGDALSDIAESFTGKKDDDEEKEL